MEGAAPGGGLMAERKNKQPQCWNCGFYVAEGGYTCKHCKTCSGNRIARPFARWLDDYGQTRPLIDG